ncbi:serine/threonine-protein kinase Sgk1-B-like [Patiria miniata]|uniref:Protein kinase domain-containing protein n=1 Tax=Patiria miniata TaxID=46514 RepID=A0A913Z226_PATMI|nr:serine/threonine-protein kinase Sgk1-B-like [Patiria miniata]
MSSKKPPQCQQSDGSQLKEDAFSQSTVTKTATESCSSAMHQQPFPENDFHNGKAHDDWKTMLRESREKEVKAKVHLKKDKRSYPQLGQQKESSNTEAVPKNASIRVETAADQGNGDDHEKAGQAKPNDDGKSQTSTWRNQQAVQGMCQDDGFQVHRNFDVSMPGRGALTTQGVYHGGPLDVIDLADLIEQLKNRNPAELRGYHQGVLLDADLKPSNGQYIQGKQYIFVRQLGEGAFGVADLLKDKTSCKYFVGKRVPFWNFAPSEPKLSSRLDHPFIVRFLGLLCTDNKVMLLSDYQLGSETLLEIIHQLVLGPVRALRILQRLLVVVFWLHSTHQIVHMDIKADNILILPGDRVQLIDFGLSRRLSAPNGASETAESQLYGMDVQSLGCTLVHMITGLPCCSHPVDFDEINVSLKGSKIT